MNDLAQRIDDNIARVADFPQPGIQYKDITSLFQQPELCSEMVEAFAEFSRGKIDAVCGIESRGFLFGLLIAQKLNLPFVLVRKQGKLPPPTVAESYETKGIDQLCQRCKGQKMKEDGLSEETLNQKLEKVKEGLHEETSDETETSQEVKDAA